MEKQLFTWSGWDECDGFSWQFYDCQLIVPIGPHPVGARFDCIYLDYENSVLRLFQGSSFDEYRLTLGIGGQISPASPAGL